MPSPDGLREHIKLSRIAGYIVTETYQIAPKETNVFQVQDALDKLDDWHNNLPTSLRIPLELELPPRLWDGEHDNGLEDRARYMLHMKWNQVSWLIL